MPIWAGLHAALIRHCDPWLGDAPLLVSWKSEIHRFDALASRSAGGFMRAVGSRDLVQHQERRVGVFVALPAFVTLQVFLQGGGAFAVVVGSVSRSNGDTCGTILLPLPCRLGLLMGQEPIRLGPIVLDAIDQERRR